MPLKSRRRFDRIEFTVSVDVQSESLLQKFHARNLSQGGIFLEVPGQPPPVGSHLTLSFDIPGMDKQISVKGKVMYVHRYQSFDGSKEVSKKGIGIMFENLAEHDQMLIATYVSGKNVSLR